MTATHSRIRSLFLEGRAGRLEAVLNVGSNIASHAALVCHPHPLYGGTLHNKVVFHAMRALNHFGFPVLRFNFRGTGLSEGEHDFGQGEVDDVRVAIDWLKDELHLPIIFAGFSFGAATGMRIACPDSAVKAIISLGTPFSAEGRLYSYEFLSACIKPKLFVSGGADQYASRSQLEQLAATTSRATLVVIEEADHFFAGKLDQMRAAIQHWIVAQEIASAPGAH